MSIYAGFFKRFFAFIVDLTLVIMVTWLLYLFPANVIINKNIDKDYKRNIKIPYDEISEKYSGTVSYFGSSTPGEFEDLKNIYSNKYISEEELNDYRSKQNNLYTTTKGVVSSLEDEIIIPFTSDINEEDRFYSKVYQIYTYLDSSYIIRNTYPRNDENILYSTQVEKGDILESQREALEKEYKENLLNEYSSLLEVMIRSLLVYNETNPEALTLKSTAYETIVSRYSKLTGKKASDLVVEFSSEDVALINNYLDEFNTYQDYVTKKETLGTKLTDDSISVIDFTEEAYYNFYYTLNSLLFNEQLPYYVQVYKHTLYSIIYALTMFTAIFSAYTMALRGNTIGRRMTKIRMTDGHEKEKLNPIYCLLHDVLFRFLYIILLGLFSMVIALIAMLAFTAADAIMIRFTKSHKTIRDILSNTRVVDGLRY